MLATRLHPSWNNALSDGTVGLRTPLKEFPLLQEPLMEHPSHVSTGMVIFGGPAEGTSVSAPLGIAHLHRIHPEYVGKNKGTPFLPCLSVFITELSHRGPII